MANILQSTLNGISSVAAGAATFGAAAAAAGVYAIGLKGRVKDTSPVFPEGAFYPSDLGTEEYPYYMTFAFESYQRRSVFDAPFMTQIGNVRLPIPNKLVNAQGINYDKAEAGLVVGAALENGLRAASNNPADKLFESVRSTITSLATNSAQILGLATASKITDTVGRLLGTPNASAQALQLAGVAQNPFLTILFKSPEFKRHSFTWRFNPRNASETEAVYKIINKFNYHALPDLSGAVGGTLLTYPDMVVITFQPSDKYLFKFKPCVIENLTINYTAEGQPSFFDETDAPTSIEMTVNLLEIEYWLKPDVKQAIAGTNNPRLSVNGSANGIRATTSASGGFTSSGGASTSTSINPNGSNIASSIGATPLNELPNIFSPGIITDPSDQYRDR